LNGKRILVTGSTGFIGNFLVSRLLKSGANVTGISLEHSKIVDNNYEHKRRSIEDIITLQKYDFIFHLAGIGYSPIPISEKEMMKANLDCTRSILKSIYNPEKTIFVFASSSSVYGNTQKIVSEEFSIPNPQSSYAKSKLSAEIEINKFAEHNNMRAVCARIFNVYGPGEKNSIVSKIIDAIINNNKMPLKSTLIRDFIFVEDVVSGLLLISKKGKGLYNLGSGAGISLREVRTIIERKTGKKLNTEILLSNPPQVSLGSIEKIKKLGFQPKIRIDKGLQMMLDELDFRSIKGA
jgi:nucleoside-diphosphate-sugar epimerase